jgi:hypothetical protein
MFAVVLVELPRYICHHERQYISARLSDVTASCKTVIVISIAMKTSNLA